MRDELKKPLVLAIIGLVIVAIVVGVAVWNKQRKTDDNSNTTNENNVGYNSYTQDGVDETPADAEVTPPQAPAKLNYTDALKIYGSSGNGFRYQFSNCSGTPGKLTMKKSTKFMIDNRDNVAHTIVIGKQTFKLGKYGFAIVTSRDLGTYNITCDGGGAASIFVQP